MAIAVVIGGSGFVGSHVADRLSNQEYQVRIFDRKRSDWLRSDQEMVVGDIVDAQALHDVIENADVVYNFAALADLNRALEQPVRTAEINILGNLNVLEACRGHQVNRFVYASTVYVHSREGSFYRCSKQASENYIAEYHEVYGLNYTILRYGSLYGPRADETNGVYRIVQSALRTNRVQYKGSLQAIREYIHVEDAARASVSILDKHFENESVTLTGQNPIHVIDVMHMVAEILGLSEDAVEFVEGKYTGHYVRTPYSYQPKLGRKYVPMTHVDLGEGLAQVISELDEQRIKSRNE